MATGSDALDSLFWRDELLQILYWLRGEGLGDAATARDLLPFLGVDEPTILRSLDRLVEDGFATRVAGRMVRYRLTELGVKEGGRRFADEFAGLTGQAHGECTDPNCGCRTLGPEACQAHGERPR